LAEYGASAPFNAGAAAPFAAAAVVWLFIKKYRGVALALLLYYAAYLAYCSLYAIQDIYYFFIPLHLAVVFLGAVGLAAVADILGRGRRVLRVAAATAVGAVILAAGGWALASNFPSGNRRLFSFAEMYGRRLLQALPAEALVFSSTDTTGNVTWYNVYIRRLRPDVAVADQVRFANRGYLTSLARRHADLILPEEEEAGALAAAAFARGTFDQANVVMRNSDDFILPPLIETVITCNASRRRIFWGLGDPGAKLEAHLVPYDLVLEAVLEEPSRAELARRAEEAVAAWVGLGASVQENGPAELRDEVFREHVALYYMSLSNRLAARRSYEAQLALLESYVGLFPDNPVGFENLGHVYAVLGRPSEAADNYRRALALAPGNVALRARLLKALSAAGRDDEVAALAAEGGEEAGEGDYFRAVAYREAGEIDKALAAFEAAEASCAGDADYWLELGVTHDAAGDYEASTRAFSRALELDPNRPWLYTARGVEKLKLGEETAAAADFEAALELNAAEAQAHYNLACVYARGGRTAEALEHVEAAVRLEPEHYLPLAREDEDLASCRDEPAFARLTAEYGGASAP
jgi:tetratricopeptide (TPR) repeat protein